MLEPNYRLELLLDRLEDCATSKSFFGPFVAQQSVFSLSLAGPRQGLPESFGFSVPLEIFLIHSKLGKFALGLY